MAGNKQRKTRLCPICGLQRDAGGMNLHFLKAHAGYNLKDYPEEQPEDVGSLRSNGHVPRESQVVPLETEIAGGGGDKTPPPKPPVDTSANGAPNPRERNKPAKAALGIEDAALLVITPRRFEFNSTFVWQAQAVTEREWGWKHTDNIGDWLDTYLWWSMKKFGIVLGGYVVLNRSENREREESLEEVD